MVTVHAGVGGVSEGTSRGNEREGALQGRETYSSPASACAGEEEARCRSKWHCFVLFFLYFFFLCRDPKMSYNKSNAQKLKLRKEKVTSLICMDPTSPSPSSNSTRRDSQ